MNYSKDCDFPGDLDAEISAPGRSVTDKLTYGPRRDEPLRRPRLARSPLSNSHNGPRIEYAINGTYAKLTIPGLECLEPPPKRGSVTDFSKKSQRRMMDMLNQVDHDQLAAYSYFTTLTYPNRFEEDRSVWRRHYRAFTKALKRRYSIQAIVWKIEPQLRLAPHYHLLIFSHDEIDNAVVAGIWHRVVATEDLNHLLWHLGELGGNNKPCTTRVNSFDGVKHYCGKYCGKDVDGGALPEWWHGGRWWGVEGTLPTNIHRQDISVQEAIDIRRMMRKLYKSKVGKLFKTTGMQGIKIYCKHATIQAMMGHASRLKDQRTATPSGKDLVDYHLIASRGRKSNREIDDDAASANFKRHVRTGSSNQSVMARDEKLYHDRLERYGRSEKTPEDCRTVLEKAGYVGLQERWDKH